MAPEFGLYPRGQHASLQSDTPVGRLNLPVGVTGCLETVGIRTLHELALTRPQLLGRIGLSAKGLRQVSALLEDFFVSLDRSELLLYSGPLQAWGPYFSQAELIRQVNLIRQIPKGSIERLVPNGGQPQPPGLKIPVEDLIVSVRAFNCLLGSGIANLHELALASPKQLLRVANLGRKTLDELASVLEEYFDSLEPRLRNVYEESYQLWQPFFLTGSGSAHSGDMVRIQRRKSESPSVTEMTSSAPVVSGEDKSELPGLKVPVDGLPVSARAFKRLRSLGVTNLHELALTLPDHLLAAKNFGRRSLRDLAKVTGRYFNSLEPESMTQYQASYQAWKPYFVSESVPADSSEALRFGKPEPAPPPSIMEAISGFVSQQSPRDREVLVRRFALLPGSRPETLDAIGRGLGLTRERIRQITVALKTRLARLVRRRRPGLDTPLMDFLREVGVATIPQIVASIPGFGECADLQPDASVRLLLTSLSRDLHPIDTARQLWGLSASMNPIFYRKVINTAKTILRGIPAQLQDLTLEIAKRLRCHGGEVQAIRAIIQNASPAFSLQPSDQRVTLLEGENVQDRRRAFAYLYIRDQGVPIAVSEVFDAMEEMEPDLLPDSPTRHSAINTLRSLLERDDRFAWAGPGVWALREWGYDPDVTSIGEAAVSLLRRAGPLTTAEIQKTLGQLYRVKPNSITAALKAETRKAVSRDSDGHWYARR